jgi:1-acyl-sn-glycerol-3-phosphate acyltransferase
MSALVFRGLYHEDVFRPLRSAWIWAANVTVILFWTPVVALVRLFDRDPRRFRTARWYRRLGRVLARINPWDVRVIGLEHVDQRRNYVVVSNHQSLADIPVLCHVPLDTKWLAKAELFRVPVLGWMLRMAGDVPVDRSDRRNAARALLECARYLRHGCSVVFFPEGTRSPDGSVLPFNEGPFQLAIREHVPVLPLAIEGSGSALPRDTWIFGPTQIVRLHVLPPVGVDGLTVKDSAALRDRVRQQIVDVVQSPTCDAPSAP